jgi:hypothetical protein
MKKIPRTKICRIFDFFLKVNLSVQVLKLCGLMRALYHSKWQPKGLILSGFGAKDINPLWIEVGYTCSDILVQALFSSR